MKIINIAGKDIGDGYPCYILAEAGCNHNRDIGTACKLIDMSIDAGVDGIKFQTYKAELMYSKKTALMKHFKERLEVKEDATMFDLIKSTELPYEMHLPIVDYCRARSIPFLSTPFDEGSVDFLEKFDVPAYKIAAFEMTHYPLLRKVAKRNKPIILSTGMSSLGDIEKALTVINCEGNDQVILLHCVSNYPAKPEDFNLRVVNTLKSAFGLPVGISDHTPGVELPKLAFASGINMIEKHITIDQSLPGPDHYFSLNKGELRDLVKIRDYVEAVMGSPVKRCTAAEEPMKKIGRRSLVAAADMLAGNIITKDMIAVKRPGYGLHPELAESLIGAEVVRDIEKDDPLSWDMFIRYS